MKRLDTYSQNFLNDRVLVGELVGHSNIRKSDTVIDIGAGSGLISSVLARRAKHVIAFETDRRLIDTLKNNLAKYDNVEIQSRDFLGSNLPGDKYKVFANIPFHLSSPILKKLTESDNPPTSIYLIVQKQFAHKLLINDRRFTGLLGAQITPLFTTKIRRPLRKTDYTPRPAVDTVLIEIKLRPEPLITPSHMNKYREFIENCYHDPIFFKKHAAKLLAASPELKPSNLVTEEWLKIFNQSSVS